LNTERISERDHDAVDPRACCPDANACGQGGSCAQYLHNTIVDLEAEGIRDRNLWHLQALVAEQIKAKQAA
jgi:cation transport regulator ChaC